ncbi:MAG: hypothetical protein JXP34_01725 [Planctomycetes bacterium]|nr:hypothetical protein [Planctomycetota bacterium]
MAGVLAVLLAVNLMVVGAWFQGARGARFRLDRFDPLRSATFRFTQLQRRSSLSGRASLALCVLRRVAIPRTPPPATPCCP